MTSPSPFRPPRRPFRAGRTLSGVAAVAGPPAPVEIPLCWLTVPVALRQQRPYTTASVRQSNFGSGYASSGSTSDFPFDASIESATPGAAQLLADFVIAYRSDPLTRSPVLLIDLMHRTDAEIAFLLLIERNQRIKLTGTPPEYPEGAQHLIVSGITNTVGVFARKLRWTTRPVIGTSPGVSGPWFYFGASSWGGTDNFIH